MALRKNEFDSFNLVTSTILTLPHSHSNSSTKGCKYTSMFSFFMDFKTNINNVSVIKNFFVVSHGDKL